MFESEETFKKILRKEVEDLCSGDVAELAEIDVPFFQGQVSYPC